MTSGSQTDTGETAGSVYNYTHFRPEHYDFGSFDGPRPGDETPDVRALTLGGREAALSEFRGSWAVLETGSITCPITDSKVHVMDELQREFEEVVSVLLYTREAHPGETDDAHDTLAGKLERARTFADECDVERTVLVDDTRGTAHRSYGGMPTSVHVIDPDGVVVMRGDWNDVPTVREPLENRDQERIYEREIYRGRPLFFAPKKGAARVLADAGPRPGRDFLRYAPALAVMDPKTGFRGEPLDR